MEILCPECNFSREVDETKIPARSQVATCPKCQTKFQFRDLPEEEIIETPAEVQTPRASETQGTLPVEPAARQAQAPLAPVETEPDEESSPTFSTLTAPGEESPEAPREELWDKLGSMTPPEPPQDEQATLPSEDQEQQPVPGWTGEFNESFPDPMQDDMASDEEEQSGVLVPPPFEQLDRYGFFRGFYLTIKLILTSPRLFFSVMPVGGGLAKPLTFTILLTMIQGFIQYFWGMAGLSTAVGPEGADTMAGVSNTLAPVLMLLFMPAFIAAGQFIISGIYHVLMILMRADNQGFEGTFRALAYANAPIILGLFPMPIPEVEIAWMCIAAVWGLFLTITGLRYIHRTSYAKVIPVTLIPLLLGMIAMLTLFQGGVPTI